MESVATNRLHSEPNLTERLYEEEKRRTNALLFRFFIKLLDGPLTALFVFNGAIDGLDRRLQLNEPRAGVYCLFTLKWRRDDLCEGASVLNQTFTGLF